MGTFIFRVLGIGSSRVKIDVIIITLKSPGKLNKNFSLHPKLNIKLKKHFI